MWWLPSKAQTSNKSHLEAHDERYSPDFQFSIMSNFVSLKLWRNKICSDELTLEEFYFNNKGRQYELVNKEKLHASMAILHSAVAWTKKESKE